MVKLVITDFIKAQVSDQILELLPTIAQVAENNANWLPERTKKGFYDFSIILPVENVWGLSSPIAKITKENFSLLQTEYVERRKGELPYLRRWFPKGTVVAEKGDHIDVICYNWIQLKKEGTIIKGDYGVVAVNVELKNPSPVPPMTMINNHLGVRYGGNGIELDRKKYRKSVKFWQEHAMIYEG
jgi:hypothetical protein